MSYRDTDETFVTTLSEFKSALKVKTEEYLQMRFRWATVEGWIDRILAKNVEDIVMDALGYENDSFDRGWKLKRHSEGGSIQSIIGQLTRARAEELLPGFIEAKREAIDKQVSTAKFKKDVVDMYSHALDRAIHDKMKNWIEQNADVVVTELFDRHAEGYRETLKLECPLTMDSLLLIAEGSDD